MITIALDSSTDVCSAALLKDGAVVAERINPSGSNHAALLPLYVEELQSEAKAAGLAIDAIVLSEGPGSYTGLRIAASLAKGLCYGMDVPLIAVPTLASIARGAMDAIQDSTIQGFKDWVCPMIDARRMEVYCAVYDGEMNQVQELRPVVVDEQSFAKLLEEHVVYFCGNGAEKCKAVLKHPNARWIDGVVPTGAEAGRLAEVRIQDSGFRNQIRVIEGKDIAYFEPNYLKEFIAAPSHVKGLTN